MRTIAAFLFFGGLSMIPFLSGNPVNYLQPNDIWNLFTASGSMVPFGLVLIGLGAALFVASFFVPKAWRV